MHEKRNSFLNSYKSKLEEGNRKQYREIINVFLELDRAGADAFFQRLVVAYFDTADTFRLDWVFIELPWKYDEVLEEMCNIPEFKKLWKPQRILTGKIENH